ncbi:2-amino-4-hydroxy-6-hydroxymethyldihydropteridine diphosphokinase [Synechococcus sp. ATX 2A4]|uniref:2-amino-4-hydroxy-6- hydroxymethyldihydropteridine diphosphokinase n=1 Tax=Synechococcus sp. ATX 2A4 TaxID=2823727 RepID=UPI0020CF0F34|nr:2-amino-4-hydroxy-6-hydroxymethyldihydropteridine diphosphokinase [Synechococcus sp. ATX 2A4]MCP9885563.1 2-amino-4-hydroxy-6-hydroxymethyldihydropteridine diphosphokinase [Synechococcus sp. ATX 2A4]
MPFGLLERTLAIALGANLDDPAITLKAVRPLLAGELLAWAVTPPLAVREAELQLRWSPLFRTAPVGGPPGQPPYLNAVLLVHHSAPPTPGSAARPIWPDAEGLLRRLQGLEAAFGRGRTVQWGPRTLDLDLLWCGDQACSTPALTLPHPRLRERAFVLAPLAALDPQLVPPGTAATAVELLAAVIRRGVEPPPQALAGGPGWAEGPPR